MVQIYPGSSEARASLTRSGSEESDDEGNHEGPYSYFAVFASVFKRVSAVLVLDCSLERPSPHGTMSRHILVFSQFNTNGFIL